MVDIDQRIGMPCVHTVLCSLSAAIANERANNDQKSERGVKK